jgi:hypothetical protein
MKKACIKEVKDERAGDRGNVKRSNQDIRE